MTRRTTLLFILLASWAVAGCSDDSGTTTPDSKVTADGGTEDDQGTQDDAAQDDAAQDDAAADDSSADAPAGDGPVADVGTGDASALMSQIIAQQTGSWLATTSGLATVKVLFSFSPDGWVNRDISTDNGSTWCRTYLKWNVKSATSITDYTVEVEYTEDTCGKTKGSKVDIVVTKELAASPKTLEIKFSSDPNTAWQLKQCDTNLVANPCGETTNLGAPAKDIAADAAKELHGSWLATTPGLATVKVLFSFSPDGWVNRDISTDNGSTWCRTYLKWTMKTAASLTDFTAEVEYTEDTCGKTKGSKVDIIVSSQTSSSPKTFAIKFSSDPNTTWSLKQCDPGLVANPCSETTNLGAPAKDIAADAAAGLTGSWIATTPGLATIKVLFSFSPDGWVNRDISTDNGSTWCRTYLKWNMKTAASLTDFTAAVEYTEDTCGKTKGSMVDIIVSSQTSSSPKTFAIKFSSDPNTTWSLKRCDPGLVANPCSETTNLGAPAKDIASDAAAGLTGSWLATTPGLATIKVLFSFSPDGWVNRDISTNNGSTWCRTYLKWNMKTAASLTDFTAAVEYTHDTCGKTKGSMVDIIVSSQTSSSPKTFAIKFSSDPNTTWSMKQCDPGLVANPCSETTNLGAPQQAP